MSHVTANNSNSISNGIDMPVGANKNTPAQRPKLNLRTPQGRAVSTTSSIPSLLHAGQGLDDEDDDDDNDDEAEGIATGANTDVDDDGYDSCAGAEDDLDVARREAWFSSALASAMIESPREVELIRSWRSAIDSDHHWSPKARGHDDHDSVEPRGDRMVTFQDLGAKHIDLTRLSQDVNGDGNVAVATPDTGRKSVSFGVAEVVDEPDYFNLNGTVAPNGNAAAGASLSRSSSVSKSCLRSRTSSMSEGNAISATPTINTSAGSTGTNGARLTSISEPAAER